MHRACLLTCEHASSRIPRFFQSLFEPHARLLQTHRGIDIGAKEYAQAIAEKTSWPLFCGEYSRLLVDLNRSTRCFSFLTRDLEIGARQQILSRFYTPFREQVSHWVEQHVARGLQVVHLSCHSFTPVLRGNVRSMDLGILYDPSCRCERELAHALQQRLQAQTSMRIRCNAPYKGISDGFVTALRKRFSPQSYVGLELEVNQGLDKTPLWRHVWLPSIIEVLKLILGDM